MRLAACIRNDIRVQFRSGFYLAYAVVTAIYIILLRVLPLETADMIAPVILFTDPSVLGLFFVGGIILLEKNDNILESLFVTPVRIDEYILSKAVSLGIISVISSLAIAASFRGFTFSFALLIIGISLTSFLFTMLGIVIASNTGSVNAYMVEAIPYILPAMAPLLWYFHVFSTPLFWLLPTRGAVSIIAGAFHSIRAAELVFSFLSLTIWCLGAFLWARHSFSRGTGRRI